jgi:tetratricopeptide (TPR) repeat protein
LKEGILDQQEKSHFVNTIAIVFIALAGIATFISLLQSILFVLFFPVEEMSRAIEGGGFQGQIPVIFKFIFPNLQIILFGFFVFSGITLVSAIGLLKRKNWARMVFIVIMGLFICFNIFGLMVQNSIFASIPGFQRGEIVSQFRGIILVMKVFSFVFTIGISYLFGWIIYRLTSSNIKKEFVASPQANQDVFDTGAGLSNKRGRNLALACSFVLVIAIGIFYFGSIKSETGLNDVRAGWEAQRRHDWDEAVRLYTRALESGDLSTEDISATYMNRGTVFHNKRQYDEAINDYGEAIEAQGLKRENLNKAYVQRGVAYWKMGQNEMALNDFNRVIGSGKITQGILSRVYMSRGVIYGQKGQYAQAMNDYDMSIELNPKDAWAYNNKAWILATCPDPNYRDGKKALIHALKAVAIKKNTANLDTLAAAYAEAGEYEMAVKTEKEAISICSNADMKKKFETLVEAYKQGITYSQFHKGNN